MIFSWNTNPQPPDYLQSALIAELFEWDTSQFMIWNTGPIKYDYLSEKKQRTAADFINKTM